ncbi:DNA polymerase III subunit gamma/tau [Legionella bononiensis]|uniref:DNA polymerase III subunit gamma/tau n=1 Tax=Legionella bononiensis TaxID=2793102 RepID=A0ABS1WGB2_9GAMM|nr:DNA polymerase III subunit gamma/tau [Legionella bononiensis]MBL7481847.1 DNA polymerase III subunit gamma/tau [Legionella bononiensis]MBL7528396.1 DNA polymerase III subunit gamma/tau [Legionella bononiensis]MBL7564359.1 DNA polymerase III subunit gamma/tau [Legionella bononiensis]
MSYLALARKWRPRTFSQLVGQEHINKALINALNQQRLHHAYLFTGTRGVGKTSVARILAKALNCETGISSEPCLQCDACTAIEQGRFIDLIEIDGASKTRVEDTRDVLDNVQYAPTNGRFKIYLIDEVHMLSQHSFNALLKTLEEPPAHVKFILATTDPQKLPVTVLSRCLQFNLKHLPADLISKHLQLILKDEELNYEVQALDILAQAAHGSMRDALSLLDQAITSCNEQLLASDVKLILGYTQQDYAVKLLDALAKQNGPVMLTLSQQIAIEGGHFQYVIDELLNYLHQIAVYQSIGDVNPLINPTDEIKNLANQFSKEDIQLFYQIGLKGREEIHLAPTLAIGFNMTLLRMLTFRPAPAATIPPLALQQSNVIAQPAMSIPVQQTEPVELIKEHVSPLIENAPSAIKSSELITEPSVELRQTIPIEAQNWASIIPELKLTGFALNAIENAEFIDKDGRDITLRVAKGHESLFTPTTTSRIEAALTDYYQSPVKIILNSKEAVQATPAQQKERAAQQKQQKAEAALHNDPLFQQIQQEFSAELVKNSIVPLKDDL